MAAAQPNSDVERGTGKTRVPFFVPLFNPAGRRLAAAGLIGPNILLTVKGRKSGIPRTTPVAAVEVDGHRWIIGTFGEVGWVHNLRAADVATVTIKRRTLQVHPRELTQEEGARFFREVLTPFVNRLPVGRILLSLLGASDIVSDPETAARERPVFELVPISG